MLFLPAKKKLIELGVKGYELPKVQQKKNRFQLIAVNDRDMIRGCVGIEFESNLTPSGQQIREIGKFFRNQKIIDSISSVLDIKELLKTHVFYNISEVIIPGIPKPDGGGLELVFNPTTHLAHKHLYLEYQRIIRVFQSFGFTDQLGTDGIHMNIDKSLFGPLGSIRRKSFANFVWFLYKNQEFMSEFCNRKRKDDKFSDMLSLLGDRFGNLDDEELMKIFMQEKNVLLDSLDSNEVSKAINIQVNKGGRPTAEFRWFGSTLSISIFMSYIDFCFAIAKFSQSEGGPKDMTLQKFCEFVEENKSEYGHLHLRMCSMTTSYEIINNLNVVNV